MTLHRVVIVVLAMLASNILIVGAICRALIDFILAAIFKRRLVYHLTRNALLLVLGVFIGIAGALFT